MNCPASYANQLGLPNESSAAAVEGTFAHLLASICLQTGKDAADFDELKDDGKLHRFTDDQHEHVQGYVDHIRDLSKVDGSTLLIEQAVAVPDEYLAKDVILAGTLDAAIVRDDVLHVLDLKFGRGVEVVAEDNPQLLIYALAQLSRTKEKIKRVKMTIYQSRISGFPFTDYSMTAADLRKWGREVLKPATQRIRASKPKFNASVDACFFCKFKPKCEAHSMFFLANIELARKPVGLMTNDEKVQLFRISSSIKNTFEQIEGELLTALENGEHISGIKRIKKVQHRKWADEKAVMSAFGDVAVKTTAVTPAQLLKVKGINKELVNQHLLEQDPAYKVGFAETKAREYTAPVDASVFDEVTK